jgi:hypothetical protein
MSSRIPDHQEAAALLLEKYAKRLRNGEYGGDIGDELVLAARVIARRI